MYRVICAYIAFFWRPSTFIPKLYLRLLWFFRRTAALFRAYIAFFWRPSTSVSFLHPRTRIHRKFKRRHERQTKTMNNESCHIHERVMSWTMSHVKCMHELCHELIMSRTRIHRKFKRHDERQRETMYNGAMSHVWTSYRVAKTHRIP